MAGRPHGRHSLTQLDTTTMLPQIKRLVTHWRKAGVNLTAIEIDYDAPTSRLSDYQRLLMAMRQGLPSDITLSITALPTGSPPRTASFAESGR